MKMTEANLRYLVRKSLVESISVLDQNKPYIMSDASLYYWLQQNGYPFSVQHYAMEPQSLPSDIKKLMDDNQFLLGFKCIGRIGSWMRGHSIYLFGDHMAAEYIVVFKDFKTCLNWIKDNVKDEY